MRSAALYVLLCEGTWWPTSASTGIPETNRAVSSQNHKKMSVCVVFLGARPVTIAHWR